MSLLNRIVKGFRFPVHYFFSYFFAYSIFFQTFSSVGGFLNLGYSIYRYKQCCQKATNLSDKYFSPTNKIIIIITLFLIVFESVFKSGSYIYISFSFFFFFSRYDFVSKHPNPDISFGYFFRVKV